MAVSQPKSQALDDVGLGKVTGGKYGKFGSYEALKADYDATFRKIPGLPGRVNDAGTSGSFFGDRPNCGKAHGVAYVYQVD